MKHIHTTWARAVGRALTVAVAVGMAVTAPPALAAEEGATPLSPPRTLAAAAAARVATLDTTNAVVSAQTASSATPAEGRSFFKTPKGIVVLVVAAGGFGYTIYSARKQAEKSQVR